MLGIGDWGLGIGQSPIPNPHPHIINKINYTKLNNLIKYLMIINYKILNNSNSST